MENIKRTEIDEEKQYGLYKRSNKQMKKTYSDHNTILINLDFIRPKVVSRKKKVITGKDIKNTKQ